MGKKGQPTFKQWFTEKHGLFMDLVSATGKIVEAALREHRIPYLSVFGRAKTVKSALSKVRTKGYRQPKKQMTDLAAIRIVTFTTLDAERACELLKQVFVVDGKRSVDKGAQLKQDKVGYRSHHFICQLDKTRLKLVEFKKFASLVFEVQVRTVLQHAWAEFEHSRNYKFTGVLPANLTRNLHLVAGLLEVADNQIAQLSCAIGSYQKEIEKKTKGGDLNLELTSAALLAFCRKVEKQTPLKIAAASTPEIFSEVIAECKDFGIKKIQDLDRLVTKAFIAAHVKHEPNQNVFGFIRDLMMFNNLDKYLTKAYKGHWRGCDQNTVSFLAKKYPRDEVVQTLKRHRVVVVRHDQELDDEPPSWWFEAPDDEPPPEDEPPPPRGRTATP